MDSITAVFFKSVMKIDVLTIFPQYFSSPLSVSLLGKANENGILHVNCHDIRFFSENRHRKVDDLPYGGGAGMVMTPGPIHRAIQSCRDGNSNLDTRVVYLGPGGTRFTQAKASELASHDHLVLLCGRYEGVDQRVIDYYVDEVISIGDFVISGGEAAALVLIEAVSRLIPGFVGNSESLVEESFVDGNCEKEYPQYTRPQVYDGHPVPEVLVSGNHEEIRKWRNSKKST